MPDDLHWKRQIHAALADANNPYEGDMIHPVGKPEVTYTRVSPEKLAEKLGLDAARKMGRSWSREMFGRRITVGEPLLDERGQELQIEFADAQEACIQLNPRDKQEAVRNGLKAREDALHKVRQSEPADLAEKVAEIHRTFPIPGIYLMDKEEWGVIEGDMGYREEKCLPQVLPKLHRRSFWSASVPPRNKENAFVFIGFSGNVLDANRGSGYRLKVRCAVGD